MIFKSFNDFYAKQNSYLANVYASLVEDCIEYDKELTDYYNNDMTNGKWKKMMSSPHVGFVTWNSDGWSYPKAKRITLSEEAKMLVSVDGDAKAYETGTLSLPLFTNTGKQRYCVTLSNGGTSDYSFTTGTLADWIQITDKDGSQVVNGGTVSLITTSKKDLKQVVVPATLKIQGHKLKVTSIGKNAFRNCSKLKKIIFQTKQLRKLGKHAFQGISKKVSVKVPKGMSRKQTKIFKNLKFS